MKFYLVIVICTNAASYVKWPIDAKLIIQSNLYQITQTFFIHWLIWGLQDQIWKKIFWAQNRDF